MDTNKEVKTQQLIINGSPVDAETLSLEQLKTIQANILSQIGLLQLQITNLANTCNFVIGIIEEKVATPKLKKIVLPNRQPEQKTPSVNQT